MPDKFLEMGAVGRPHGIKGEIGVDWHGDFIPPPGSPIFLRKPGREAQKFTMKAIRRHNGRLLVLLEGVEDRNSAENFKGAQVLLPRQSLPPLKEDEAYLDDLPGFAVMLENGEKLGVLDHLEFPAGREIWAIKDVEDREILFPAREEFIKEIDLPGRKVVVSPPPGLVDIYRA